MSDSLEQSKIICPDCGMDNAIVDSWEVEGNKFCVRCGITVKHSPLYDSSDGTKKTCDRCNQETDKLYPLLNCEAVIVKYLCRQCYDECSVVYVAE